MTTRQPDSAPGPSMRLRGGPLFRRWLLTVTGSWIVTTAVAWLAGLGVFLGFATPLWQPGQPLALTIAISRPPAAC